MGPQLYRCGNTASRDLADKTEDLLQWGRNFIVAEIKKVTYNVNVAEKLQWGRSFIVAEMG